MKPVLRLALASALMAMACGTAARAQFNGPTEAPGMPNAQPLRLTTDRALLFPPVHDQYLVAGDQLTVRLFGQPDYNPVVRVANDGTIQLPLIGTVPVVGISIDAAERLIEKRLQDAGMYDQPQVTLQVTDGPNANVTIVGEAHGVIPVVSSRRLLDVLSAAGGLPASASHVITINRPGAVEPIVVDLGNDPARSELANIPLFPGDTVIVSRVGVVYMVGEFKTPGTIPLSSYGPLTLTEATAIVGGSQFDAKLGDVHIIRTVGDHRTVVKLDVNAVLNGKSPDPILQPNDIVYLPPSAVKVAIQQGGISVLFSAVSLALTSIAILRQ